MKVEIIPPKPKEEKLVRVAAYARVSSDKDAAFHSLEAQTDYYQEYVRRYPNWQLVSIYSDNGISGTTLNRPEFQRMLEDCRNGKIDLIITKSISRFARNIVILLETIRELRRIGVDVYFEKEDMYISSPEVELLLTLLAMYAEEEARSASENQKWRIQKKFEKGEPWVGNMLGYRLVNGNLVVVPEEAEIVRQIFADYLSGMGRCSIAKKLKMQGVVPANGNTWSDTSIRHILTNVTYTGNLTLQKTYHEDFRTKRKKINKGKKRMYFVENSHEAIIDQATYDKVQAEISLRAEKSKEKIKKTDQTTHLFCGILKCDKCGRNYIYRQSSNKKSNVGFWSCPNFSTLGKTICPAKSIPEDILIAKSKEILSVPKINREIIISCIEKIIVCENNNLRFILKDGNIITMKWQHHSRSESWTPEMREAARQKTLERYRKEEK